MGRWFNNNGDGVLIYWHNNSEGWFAAGDGYGSPWKRRTACSTPDQEVRFNNTERDEAFAMDWLKKKDTEMPPPLFKKVEYYHSDGRHGALTTGAYRIAGTKVCYFSIGGGWYSSNGTPAIVREHCQKVETFEEAKNGLATLEWWYNNISDEVERIDEAVTGYKISDGVAYFYGPTLKTWNKSFNSVHKIRERCLRVASEEEARNGPKTIVDFGVRRRDESADLDGATELRAAVKATRDQLDNTKNQMHSKLLGLQDRLRGISNTLAVVGE